MEHTSLCIWTEMEPFHINPLFPLHPPVLPCNGDTLVLAPKCFCEVLWNYKLQSPAEFLSGKSVDVGARIRIESHALFIKNINVTAKRDVFTL